MTDWVKRALTRRPKSRSRLAEVAPSERLLLGVKFTIALTFSLTALEIAHLALLGKWNNEIFSTITGLSGTLAGVLISQRAGD